MFKCNSRGECLVNIDRGKPYGEHNKLRDEGTFIDFELAKKSSGEKVKFNEREHHSFLHKLYIGIDEGLKDVWEHFVTEEADAIVARKGWAERDASQNERGGWEFSHKALWDMHVEFEAWGDSGPRLTDDEQIQVRMFPLDAEGLSSITLNGVQVVEGDWILARPNEEDLNILHEEGEDADGSDLPAYGVPNVMWFGKVKRMFRHVRHLEAVEVFDVEWHRSAADGPYDVNLMCPIVEKAASVKDDPFIRANSVLPWPRMIALKHPLRATHLVMISKTWMPLSAAKMPVPFPNLMCYPTA